MKLRTSRRSWVAAAAVCGLAGASFLTPRISTPAPPAAAPISLGFALDQPQAPLKVLSTTATGDFLFDRIVVKNVSDQRVTSATFGAMVYSPENRSMKPMLIVGRAVPTVIKPGKERQLEPLLLPPSEAQAHAASLKAGRLYAQLGLLSVGFADGSTWTDDPEAPGTFGRGVSGAF